MLPIPDTHMFLALPQGWECCHDLSGRVYRANRATMQATLPHPTCTDEPAPLAPQLAVEAVEEA